MRLVLYTQSMGRNPIAASNLHLLYFSVLLREATTLAGGEIQAFVTGVVMEHASCMGFVIRLVFQCFMSFYILERTMHMC